VWPPLLLLKTIYMMTGSSTITRAAADLTEQVNRSEIMLKAAANGAIHLKTRGTLQGGKLS